MLKTVVLLNIFLWKFIGSYDYYKSSKDQPFLKIKYDIAVM